MSRRETFAVVHVEHRSDRSFDDVVAAFEAATGDVQDGAFAREAKASGAAEDFERRMASREGESGFMRFLTIDHGEWLSLYGQAVRCRLYVLGNPLVALTMLRHDARVGLNVPVRLIVYETPTGEARVGYDLPSSLMGYVGSAEVAEAASGLDAKLLALAERITR